MKQLLKKIIIFILKIEAKLVLQKYQPKIITITGSVGKTSTKDAIYAVLSSFFFVRKNKRSVSSEIDIPLTILGCSTGQGPITWLRNILHGLSLLLFKHEYPEWLLLEMGVRKPGDMERIVSWINSTIVIVTYVGAAPSHIEFFKSREHLIEEKSKLIKTLKPEGVLMLNADDSTVFALREKTKTKSLSFGFNTNTTMTISNADILYKDNLPYGITFRINYEGNSVPITIEKVFGKNHIYAATVALLVAHGENINMIEAVHALKKYKSPPGRTKLIEGVKETLIIDDTYNSSPSACEDILQVLKDIKVPGIKFAVLGDMLELGRLTDEAHKTLGKGVATSADILITVGIRARIIAVGAKAKGMSGKNIFQFEDARVAGKFVEQKINKGDIILVKGSQIMKMERTVEEIMAAPNKKKKLLVRQNTNTPTS